MSTKQCDIGMIGLGVMGENLALNMESKGFSVAVFNRTHSVTEKFMTERGGGKNIIAADTLEKFCHCAKSAAQSDADGESRRAGRCGHR